MTWIAVFCGFAAYPSWGFGVSFVGWVCWWSVVVGWWLCVGCVWLPGLWRNAGVRAALWWLVGAAWPAAGVVVVLGGA